MRWELESRPSVTVVIPTRSRETLLALCLDGLARTEYPNFNVVVVDSGGRTDDAERWYAQRSDRLVIEPVWWEGPFNYSAANNLGARAAGGEVLVFINDDTDFPDPGWLDELVGWLGQPGIGLVGLQLTDGVGAIQHGGAVLGMNGFAGHLFAGMTPGEDSLLGSTSWYRNCLSVTGACVAIERALFEQIGGFDERFQLCGSDVVLGLDVRFHGHRTVCSPYGGVRHLEAQSRGPEIPPHDFFTSYWRYQRWLRGGDPYFSPNLSLQDNRPRLRRPGDPDPMTVVGAVLDREFAVFRQSADERETEFLVKACKADRLLRDRVSAANRDRSSPRCHLSTGSCPTSTARSTEASTRRCGSPTGWRGSTASRTSSCCSPDRTRSTSAQRSRPPSRRSRSRRSRSATAEWGPNLQTMPPADVSIATQWHTAYMAANFTNTRRRFYLIQDFEPLFYPAGSNYALAEETYRLGLYGVCNTEHMLELYRRRYGGEGMAFTPAVDGTVFHPGGRVIDPAGHSQTSEGHSQTSEGEPVTIFTYARPGHWRNCWEMASLALRVLKQRLGDRVRVVTAGSWARPDDLGRGIEHLGLLDYRETGELYRSCDVGLALTVSEHPSYLPLELLACGTPVVAFDNPAGDWLLHHEHNCLRCPRTVDGIVEALERLATDGPLRRRLATQGIADIAERHSDWDVALAGIYAYLCDPG